MDFPSLILPQVVGFGGKKCSGKDFAADTLVEAYGYTKIHIATPWLQNVCCPALGISWEEYQTNKATYRARVQELAAGAREENARVLVEELDRTLQGLLEYDPGRGIAVSGLRFHNEALYFIRQGFFVAKVEVGDDVRRQRFTDKGESLALFDDPFECEIDDLPNHVILQGDKPAWYYPLTVSLSYRWLTDLKKSVVY